MHEADEEFLLRIYDLAAEHDVPVNVHVDFVEAGSLERALAHDRSVNLLWAHRRVPAPADPGAPGAEPEPPRRSLDAQPVLSRAYPIEDQRITDADGTLKPGWRSLLEDHPDRFLFGTDVGPPGRAEIIDDVTEYFRDAFSQLPDDVARRIASENARDLFGFP